MNTCKVLLIILDGANVETINLLKDNGYIKGLIKKGYYNTTESVLPPLSVPASISLYTGLNPAKLGIVSVQKDDGSLVTSNDIEDGKTVWEILNRNGYKCGVVNALLTWPTKRIDGFLISGYPTPNYHKNYTFPKGIEKGIKFVPSIDVKKRYSKYDDKYDVLKSQILAIENNFNIIKKMFRKFETDFLCFHITGTDYLQHMFYEEKDIIQKYYNVLDDLVSDLYDFIKPENIIIASDHGFSKFPKYKIHINKWLEDRGYLKIRGSTALKNIIKMILPERIKNKISKSSFVKKEFKIRRYKTGINVDKNIDIEKLIRELKDLKYENKYVFKFVKRREDVYSGPYIDMFPNIVLLPNEDFLISGYNPNNFISYVRENDKKYREISLQGIHFNSNDAIIITDIKIKKNTKLKVLDIVPLILNIFSVPIPKDIDGKINKNIFEKKSELSNKEIFYEDLDNKKINNIGDRIQSIINDTDFI